MEIDSIRKPHIQKKEKIATGNYKLPITQIRELENEATSRGIPINTLLRQILDKFFRWDRFADKNGFVHVPSEILKTLNNTIDEDDINAMIVAAKQVLEKYTLFLKGKYDLKRCLETLEDYMKSSGMGSDHKIEGDLHHFIVKHNLGIKWSEFIEQLFKELFHHFVPEKNCECKITKSMVIATISLGSDFDEHDY